MEKKGDNKEGIILHKEWIQSALGEWPLGNPWDAIKGWGIWTDWIGINQQKSAWHAEREKGRVKSVKAHSHLGFLAAKLALEFL